MLSLTYHFLSDFRRRSFNILEDLGDTAADAQRYDEALSHYTTALSLGPPSPQGILIKRNKAYMAIGSWKQALEDADKVCRFTVRFNHITHRHIRLSCTIRRRHGVTR